MASSSSSSRTWKYDVFPSFSGEDVRKSFLSHFLEKLQGKSIITFIDNRIERSRLIELELLLAIRQSRISIVVFSKKYASSTWCLNELVEIHECHEESNQMVIPIFYEVDPSHVRKQTGEFGKAFDVTCKGKTEDGIRRWRKALAKVAGLAGYDSQNWSGEAEAIELISKDVLNKLMLTQSDDFRDFVGIDAHVDAIMDSKLCLESGGVRMVGIVGPSGIGKTTIARALYSRLSSSKFEHRAFASYKRTMQDKKIADFGMKLSWAKHFLSEILCQKDIKIESLGLVEQRLKHRKVLIVLDDVDEIELLETLVGKVEWFGFGSRIVVVTQDRALLESHEIDLIYEVQFPSQDLALQMFCQSAFGKASPPDGFMELAAEVANLSANLPLGLNVLGSSLRKKNKEYWVEMMPRLRNGLNGKIEKTLRVCYDGLDEKDDQDIFIYIACLFNGESVSYIKNLLEKSCYTSVNTSLRTLADKSLARITTQDEIVQMHILLEKLGREIVRSESINNPGKRRFLVDPKDIFDVFNDNIGTKNVLGIRLDTSEINEPLFIDDKSFEGMPNLRFINFFKEWWPHKIGEVRFCLPHQGLIYFPRKLRLLHWDDYPAKYIPSNFKAEHLVELIMKESKLEKLWEGAQPLQSLKKMNVAGSRDLKEIPDLSNATNLEILNICNCTSLVTLPSSIRNLKKLIDLSMERCSKLEILPTDVNLESLDYLILSDCSRLRNFPRISRNISTLFLDGTAMEEEDCLWIENFSWLIELVWENCPLRCMPPNFHPEHLTHLSMRESKLEKLWEGVQSLTNLTRMDLSNCGSLKEIPDLSKAINLEILDLSECESLKEILDLSNVIHLRDMNLSGCKSLEEITDLSKAINLEFLNLSGCKSLKEIPDLSNATNLEELDLSGCKSLKEITDLSKAINLEFLNLSGCESLKEIPDLPKATKLKELNLENCTSLKKLPDSVQNLEELRTLNMRGCTNLEDLPRNINLVYLTTLDLSGCSRLRTFPQLSTSIEVLDLSDTAIEEVPFWIENIVGLTQLLMSGCTSLEDLPTNINLESLTTLDFSGCSRLRTFPQLSTSIKELYLSNTAIKEVPSWIENIVGLSELWMSGCTSLEVLPTNINLVYLTTLDLSGCSRLRTFPQLSTSIKCLYLSDTAIEEVPSWIENITWLTHLEMSGCEKLKEISANIWNLKHLQCVDFTDCGGVTSVSDTSLVKTVAELHEEMYLSCYDSDTEFLFHNCFNLDQDAQKFILQSDFRYAILPGKKVPTYFTHRVPGSSLTVPLPQSSLSQNHLRFTAYIIPDLATCFLYFNGKIIVHWKFRGVEGAHEEYRAMDSAQMDHLGVFHFTIFFQEDPPSQLDCNNVEFEFKLSYVGTSSLLPIKECGVRVLDVCSSLDASDRRSETEYTGQSEESDEESGRSKKRMQMTVEPTQVHSNLPGGKTAVNSESMAPCVETLYGNPIRTEQEDTHCGSFLVSAAHKLFQMMEITFREVSNLFCSPTVPTQCQETPT